MSRWNGQIFLAALSILLAGSLSSLAIVKMHTHAASGNKTKKLSELTVGQVVKVGGVSFVKTAADQLVAINLCPDDSTYSSFYQGCVSATTDFAYTGGEQTFSVPADGYYVLEVWGAQGGSYEKNDIGYPGGYGGYSIGVSRMSPNTKIYINVGGQGTAGLENFNGGYNGGGLGGGSSQSGRYGGSGGGASHIATVPGVLSTLSAYKDTNGPNISREILIVAGAGSSGNSTGHDNLTGAHGGGYIGNAHTLRCNSPTGGSQTTGGVGGNPYHCRYAKSGSFGTGASINGTYLSESSGGGGGWYGGGACFYASGGGGSGYIGSSNLISLPNFPKHMTCRDCLESTESATLTFSNTCASESPTADCAKLGHGAARITQLSVYLGI